MIRHMKAAVAELKQSITRWKSDLARAEGDGQSEIAAEIHGWIKESESIIAEYEKIHASQQCRRITARDLTVEEIALIEKAEVPAQHRYHSSELE